MHLMHTNVLECVCVCTREFEVLNCIIETIYFFVDWFLGRTTFQGDRETSFSQWTTIGGLRVGSLVGFTITYAISAYHN
jgi:hypothetical protein